MDKAELTPEECNQICAMCGEILKVIGYAQGREASYALRREEFKIIQFPSGEQEANKEGKKECQTAKRR